MIREPLLLPVADAAQLFNQRQQQQPVLWCGLWTVVMWRALSTASVPCSDDAGEASSGVLVRAVQIPDAPAVPARSGACTCVTGARCWESRGPWTTPVQAPGLNCARASIVV